MDQDPDPKFLIFNERRSGSEIINFGSGTLANLLTKVSVCTVK
jgi:hypothetical protein